MKITILLNAPLQVYKDDFSFIVSGEEFKTSHLVSDLISPKNSEYHWDDPTLSEFIINTEHKGYFSHAFELSKFRNISILEVIELLGNVSICVKKLNEATEITGENILDLMHMKKMPTFQ